MKKRSINKKDDFYVVGLAVFFFFVCVCVCNKMIFVQPVSGWKQIPILTWFFVNISMSFVITHTDKKRKKCPFKVQLKILLLWLYDCRPLSSSSSSGKNAILTPIIIEMLRVIRHSYFLFRTINHMIYHFCCLSHCFGFLSSSWHNLQINYDIPSFGSSSHNFSICQSFRKIKIDYSINVLHTIYLENWLRKVLNSVWKQTITRRRKQLKFFRIMEKCSIFFLFPSIPYCHVSVVYTHMPSLKCMILNYKFECIR